MAKRVAVLLSGCGVYDGSEIQEAVFTLLALDQAGALVHPSARRCLQRLLRTDLPTPAPVPDVHDAPQDHDGVLLRRVRSLG